MDAVNRHRIQLIAQMQPFFSRLWYILRNFRTTAGLLILLALVLAVGLLLSQQQITITPNTAAQAAWLNNLPAWVQPVGEVLYVLGFAHIFYTPWFWIPVALLLLNSLIALADYMPGCRRRMRGEAPSVAWQHPLARRVEHSVRLSHFPDDFTELFRVRFNRQGFSLHSSSSEQQRVTAASRRRWGWLGIPLIYLGLLTLVFALLLTFFSLKTERLTLSPLQPRSVGLLGGQLDLITTAPDARVSQLKFTPDDAGVARLLSWRHYQPGLINNMIVFPMDGESIVTVEVSDSTGDLLELDPLPENLLPTEHLRVILDDGADESIYFTVPSMDIAVQVLPDAVSDAFSVQVRRGDQAELIDNALVMPGQEFKIEGMTAMLSLDHNIKVIVRRDMGLPLYILAVALIVSGGILALLRPAIIWLIPEVKGIGGQLYGVMETFGSERKMTQILEQLLVMEDTSAGENGESHVT